MNLFVEKELFQWEKNRYVYLSLEENDPTITYMQFYNSKSTHGPEILLQSGKAKIPNYLLADGVPVMAIACTGTKGNTKPIMRKEFKVIKRARPDYYYEDNDDPGSDTPDVPDVPGDDDNKDIIYDGGEET